MAKRDQHEKIAGNGQQAEARAEKSGDDLVRRRDKVELVREIAGTRVRVRPIDEIDLWHTAETKREDVDETDRLHRMLRIVSNKEVGEVTHGWRPVELCGSNELK